MRETQSGFTLVEVLVVVVLLALMFVCLLPNEMGNGSCALSDEANLRHHHGWLLTYERKHDDALPQEGGHKFVLATWTAGLLAHTPENFDRFWTPGPARANDTHYAELRKLVERGEDPWPSLPATRSGDTHYVGRRKAHESPARSSASEAWMANDNEGGWSMRDGSVRVLFCHGAVRTYSYRQLQEQYGLGPFDPAKPVVTWGQHSPIPPCRTLDK